MSIDTIVRALHFLAAAAFAGGLAAIGLVAVVSKSKLDPERRAALFRALGRRFGVLSVVSLAVLVGTGTYMADQRLTSVSELFDTEWGRVLAWKLGLVILTVALVAVHSFVVGPRMRRLREEALANPQNLILARRLKRSEALAGVLNGAVLALTVAIIYLAAKLVTG